MQENPCQRCGGAARATATIPPLGNTLGHRIFYCVGCDHYTWIEWRGSFYRPPDAPSHEAQQQQQQEQPPPKDDEK